MKKILVAGLLFSSITVFAHGHSHGHHRGSNWGPWIGGAIAGAIIYDIYNRPVVVQPPVVVQQIPVYQSQQNCGPWVETQNTDGSITRSRTCNQ